MVGFHPHLAGQLGMNLQHPLFPVDRNKEFRLDQGMHDFQFFLTGVAGHMEGQFPFVEHLYALAVEFIDHIANGVFIAWNRGGGNNHPVAWEQVHLPVGVERHSGEGGHRLTLTAGGDDTHPVFRQGFDVVQIHKNAVRDTHIAQFGGHFHHVFHGPAGNGHLSAVPVGHINDLLNAVHVGSKGGDNDALLAPPKQGVEGGTHAALRPGVARAFHIGGVGQQGQHAFLTQLTQTGQVHHPALNGGGVNFKVAGVDTNACRTLDGEGHRIRNGVVHMDKLHAEPPRLDQISRLTGNELGLAQQAVLLQLQFDEPSGHAGSVDGGVHRPQDIGQGPNVVLVAVGDEDTANLVLIFDKIGHVRDDHVDAVHIVIGEPHAAVHHDNVAAILVYSKVLSDFIEAAQGNNFQFFCHDNSFLFHIDVSRQKIPWKTSRTPGTAYRRRTAPLRPCLAG